LAVGPRSRRGTSLAGATRRLRGRSTARSGHARAGVAVARRRGVREPRRPLRQPPQTQRVGRGLRGSRRRGDRTGAGTAGLLLPDSRLLRRRGCRRGLGRRGLLGLPVGGLLAVLLREPDLEVEEEADRLLLDRLVHRLEQLEAL